MNTRDQPASDARQRISRALELMRGGRLVAGPTDPLPYPTVDELVRAVADHFQVPRMELDNVQLAPELGELIPRHLAERRGMIAVFASDAEISVATCDPTQIEMFDWLEAELHRRVTVVVAAPEEIERAIRRVYDPLESVELPKTELSEQALQEATHVIDRIVRGAIDRGASDIHIEAGESETVVRYRIDGMLRVVATHPSELHPAIVSRIKVLARLDISIRHVPQDGRIKLDDGRQSIDLRVSILPTFYGEKVCCRIIDNERACLPLDQLGYDPRQLAAFNRIIRLPFGLILVTGPTGSGKSTTLYSALNTVRSTELNIVSVEDPIEYQLPGINQVGVNVRRGLTFASALRSILRQDPDVILIGEIRDRETAMIATEAALTGHLVLASLHTNDAVSSINRLTELGVEPFLVAPALAGVISQRLLRTVCAACATDYAPSAAELARIGVPTLPAQVRFKRARGCDSCRGTGYSGRVAVSELLEGDEGLSELIAAGATSERIRDHARGNGFRPLRVAALRRLIGGQTTIEEVIRVSR